MGGLYDCLAGVYHGKADESILDKYSEIRREKYNTVVNPISSQNIVRLFGQDPDKALENDEFLKLVKRTETDQDFSRQFQLRVNALMHDFTQYYHQGGTEGGHTNGVQEAGGVQQSNVHVVAIGSD